MHNLIIIGNGFDLAHGLKTGYNDFIKDLFDNYFQNKESYPNIFKYCPSNIDSFDKLTMHLKQHPSLNLETRAKSLISDRDTVFENSFIEFLLYQFLINNWSDIESIYFDELIRYKENNLDPKILNDEFNVIKEYLSKYLQIEEKKAQKIKSYETLFNEFCQTDNALILSFNYTKTIKNLYKDVIKCPIIHIHGELENKENPMIFGYAGNHAESRELLAMNNNEYMKNILIFK